MKDKKVKKGHCVNEKTLLVSIDLGKGTHYGYLRGPKGEEIGVFPIKNRLREYNEFYRKMVKYMELWGLEEIVVGYESSGPYGEPLVQYLFGKGVGVVQVNPLHTKRVKELTGNSPNKTDMKDPRVIADVMILGHALSVIIPTGPSAELRRLTQARERAVEKQTATVNQLRQVVYVIFPEWEDIFQDINCKSSRELLKHYPTPEEVAQLGVRKLANFLHQGSRGRIGKERSEALYVAARESVGIREGLEAMKCEIGFLVKELEQFEEYIAQLEKRMEVCLQKIPYSRSILSVKGIKTVTAAGLIGEVGDFQAFHSSKELLKLAGLNLYEVSSGIHRGEKHITKRGRSLLRKILYCVLLNMVKPGGTMHDTYQAALDRGKSRTSALVMISRKLLKILFALVHNHSVYQVQYSVRQAA